MGRWVGRAEVIHRLHDAPSEEVAPDAVDDSLGKVGIFRRGHPFGQPHAQIPPLAVGKKAAVGETGRDLLLGPGMKDLGRASILAPAVPLDVVDHEIGAPNLFDLHDLSHVAEKGRQPPELILAPVLEGMVVTLGAPQPPSQEDPDLLGGDFGNRGQVPKGPIRPGRTAEALGGQPLSRHPVVGNVGGNVLPNPILIDERMLRIEGRPGIHSEHLTEKIGPVIDILGRVQESFDQRIPLAGIPTRQEFTNPVGRRQGSGQVQADAPQELAVGGGFGGNDVEALQLSKDVPVDVVPLRHLGIPGQGPGNHPEPGAGGLPGRADHHRAFSDPLGRHHSRLVHLHDLMVIGLVEHLLGDVFAAPVGHMGGDQQTVPSLAVQDHLSRQDLQPLDAGALFAALLAVGRPVPDPTQQDAITGGLRVEPLASSVGHRKRGLQQQQRLFRILQIDSGLLLPGRLGRHYLVDPPFGDPAVILPGKQRVHRQLQASLSLDAPVALAVVASGLGEDGSDVPGKAEGPLLGDPVDHDPGAGRPVLKGGRQDNPSVGTGHHLAGRIDLGHLRIGKVVASLVGDIPLQAVGEPSQQQELLGSLSPPDLGIAG